MDPLTCMYNIIIYNSLAVVTKTESDEKILHKSSSWIEVVDSVFRFLPSCVLQERGGEGN